MVSTSSITNKVLCAVENSTLSLTTSDDYHVLPNVLIVTDTARYGIYHDKPLTY